MSSSWIIFDPMFPLWAIVFPAALILSFCILKEIRRRQRFVVARIISIVVVIISILGVLLRPSLREEKSEAFSILLTEGYTRAKADSLAAALPFVKFFQTADASPYPGAETLESDFVLGDEGSSIRFILGSGLSGDQADMIQQKQFTFLRGEQPDGVTDLTVGTNIVVNRASVITGTVNSKDDGRISITGPAGIEDSVDVKKGASSFSLSIRPKVAGLFNYTLAFKGNNTLWSTSLPVEVRNEERLRILILQKFPTAEIRYLKNFLSEKGHALTIRYQTSKTNFKYEFSNTASIKTEKITPQLTAATDLLFIDSSVLTELGSTEKEIIKNSIHSGMGMIILDIPEKEKSIAQFLPLSVNTFPSDTVHLQLTRSGKYVLPAQPIDIKRDAAIRPVMTHDDRILSGYRYDGAGKVGFQLLKETYRAQLEGNTDDYMDIWSSLIEQTARSKGRSFRVKIANAFPIYPYESIDVSVISSGQKPVLMDNTIRLPLAEDVLVDDQWLGKTWAGQPGWHSFVIRQDSTTVNYYVSEKNDWKALRFSNQVKATEMNQSTALQNGIQTSDFATRPISPIWFFLFFILASAFLWLAPKI